MNWTTGEKRDENARARIRIRAALCLCLVAVVYTAPRGERPRSAIASYPSEAELQALDDQVWSLVARIPAADLGSTVGAPGIPRPSPAWRALLRGTLRRHIGDFPNPEAGKILSRASLVSNGRYTIDWVRATSRLPGTTVVGYLAVPTRSTGSHPGVVLIHGADAPPHIAFGWRLRGDDPFVGYPNGVPLTSVATALVEAGYTVFVPWLSDALPACVRWNTCGFTGRTAGETVKWEELDRWGAVLSQKTGATNGAYRIAAASVVSAVDLVLRTPLVDHLQLAVAGWSQGAAIAGVSAALDDRIRAVLWLGPPVDSRAVAGDPQAIRREAPAALSAALFGQPELAALIAPRPLQLLYSLDDPAVARVRTFVSNAVFESMRREYAAVGADGNLSRDAAAEPAGAGEQAVRWLDSVFHRVARPRGATPAAAPAPEWPYPQKYQDEQRAEFDTYLAGLPALKRRTVRPSYESLGRFAATVEPLRRELREALAGRDAMAPRPVRIIERRRLPIDAPYTLEWIRFEGRVPGTELGAWLATPTGTQRPKPAVLSFDNNYNVGWLFGLDPAPFPYLHEYGDRLARRGYVVLAPYLPSFLVEGWAAIIRAKTMNQRSIWSYLLPLYWSGVDLLSVEPGVDAGRIAAYGISFSGVAALLASALDDRIDTLVYSNSVIDMVLHSRREAASQAGIWQTEAAPFLGLAQRFLIAPRRFVWETGDNLAGVPDAALVLPPIRQTYQRLGVPDRFEFVRHSAGHETFGGSDGPYYAPPEGFDIYPDRAGRPVPPVRDRPGRANR